jgi:hypothetical protein
MCHTNHERGNGTIFDEVTTFHSVPRTLKIPCSWPRRRLEFAFGLQPIIDLVTWEATALKMYFIGAQPDFFGD